MRWIGEVFKDGVSRLLISKQEIDDSRAQTFCWIKSAESKYFD